MNRFINIKQRFRIRRRGSKSNKNDQGLALPKIVVEGKQATGEQQQGTLSAPVTPIEPAVRAPEAAEVVRPHMADSGIRKAGSSLVSRGEDGEQSEHHPEAVEVPGSTLLNRTVETEDVHSATAVDESELPADYEQAEEQYQDVEVQDDQTVREPNYLEFGAEDEDDYTAGPARLVATNDGLKPCAALLMTLELSAVIKESVRAQRGYETAERRAARESEVITNFEMACEREISSHQTRLACLEDAAEAYKSIEVMLREETAALEAMLQNSKMERKCIDARLQSQATTLREIQGLTSAFLEEAFVAANLLGPRTEEVEPELPDLDLQEQYQLFRAGERKEQGLDAEDEVTAPLDTTRGHMLAPPLSSEEQARQDLRDALWAADERLNLARAAFNRRSKDRAYEEDEREVQLQRGEQLRDATIEDFDRRWFLRNHELTREVIDAEAGLREAKAAMVEGGIEYSNDEVFSGFADRASDGYGMQFEDFLVKSAPRPKITQWLDALPEKAGTPLEDEFVGDEWETETRSVGIDDSASAVPEDPVHKERIAKWRRLCGLE
ncbi:hypothetical protein LTR78_005396 [Recurvomyces mirabilis]|uniref:Uncharacterized protein n=1 Tax=Recurvomyces mirabilis TaxID=574656 RepID=A0AAE0WMV5_9PEZI|nr:hypothetical protein LTR78_005396 [Recurvomyces mirabilis]KAK5152697.1 hypothetical protein LTS14_008231 [Recurvomyces mirabilis]